MSGKSNIAPWKVKRACRLLKKDITVNIPVSSIATACGLTEYHFNRGFKNATGQSMHRWLINYRIDVAKAMMLEFPLCKISEIALACGFTDQSHLSRQFRAKENLPPATWRQKQFSQPLVQRS